MNIYILIILLVATKGEESSGSIFSFVGTPQIQNYDPSDSQVSKEDSAGEPLESFSSDENSDSVTEVPQEDPEAENYTVPEGDSENLQNEYDFRQQEEEYDSISDLQNLQRTNELLTEQNQKLIEEAALMEGQFYNAMEKVNKYRIDEEQTLNSYSSTMKTLDLYNKALLYDSDEENEDEELQASFAMVTVIGLGFLFLIMHAMRSMMKRFFEEGLNHALYSLLVDVCILVFIWCLTALVDYFDILDEDKIELDLVLVGFAVFIVFWLVMGLWLLIAAQAFSRRWQKHEDLILQAEGNYSSATLKYSRMRLHFIAPAYLAPLSEVFLRADFDFADYLTRAIGDVITKTFHMTWIGYFLIVLAVVFWRLIIFGDKQLELVFLWVIPAFLLCLCVCIIFKLKKVVSQLVPEPKINEVNIPFGSIDPKDAQKIIHQPKYLRGKLPPPQETQGLWSPYKMTSAYIFLGRYPNRHELLFWMDSFGPRLMVSLVQGVAIVSSLWITVICLYYIPMLLEKYEFLGFFLVVLACLIWLTIAFYVIPEAYRLLTLATKTEMMKDRALINQVVSKNKQFRVQRSCKIARQLKMIYREIKRNSEGEEKAQILHRMKKLTEESFLLVCPYGTKKLEVKDLDNVMDLIGIHLEEDELRVFAKECEPDEENQISLNSFKNAIERILFSFELKVHEVTKEVIQEYLIEQDNLKETITLEELTAFFNEWSWHFSEDDVREFLVEVQFLSDDKTQIEIDKIANMLRVDVESLPK